jgi:hypothetical protein
MAKLLTLTITIDPSTYASELNGPVNSPPAMYWLIGEAQRLWALHLNKKQAQPGERRIHIPDLHIGP